MGLRWVGSWLARGGKRRILAQLRVMQPLLDTSRKAPGTVAPQDPAAGPAAVTIAPPPAEIDGPAGPEPTRYGDWERKGRCIDF